VVNDSLATIQELTINGNYLLKDSVLEITWMANEVFPSRKSVFTMYRAPYNEDSEYWPLKIRNGEQVYTIYEY
jgi:hypothetical protein